MGSRIWGLNNLFNNELFPLFHLFPLFSFFSTFVPLGADRGHCSYATGFCNVVHVHTVECEPFIESQFASRNSLYGLMWCKFGHVTSYKLEGTKPAYSAEWCAFCMLVSTHYCIPPFGNVVCTCVGLAKGMDQRPKMTITGHTPSTFAIVPSLWLTADVKTALHTADESALWLMCAALHPKP